MADLAKLVVSLEANIAKFTDDMAKASSTASTAMKGIEQAASVAKQGLIALTGIASIDAFKGMIQGAIEGVAQLHKLSLQAGMTVEQLSALASVGKATGTGADVIAGAANKMSKALASSNEDSKGAATALKALGLSFSEFQNLSPDERMVKVAQSMSQFADDGNKSAAAMLLFGKTGAEMLPFLKDLAETGELHARVTSEQAEQAHHYEVTLGQLQAKGEAWKKSLALSILPALDDIAGAMLQMKKNTTDLGFSLGEFINGVLRNGAALLNGFLTVLKQVGLAIGAIAAIMTSPWQDAKSIFAVWMEDAKELNKATRETNDKILGLTGDAKKADKKDKTTRPTIQGLAGNAAGAVDEGKSFLEGLQRQVESAEKGKFAMLELEAAQKKVVAQAQPWINRLQEIESRNERIKRTIAETAEAETQRAKVTNLVNTGNDMAKSMQQQAADIGKTADELARLAVTRKLDEDLSKAMVDASVETRQELEKVGAVIRNNVLTAYDAMAAKKREWSTGATDAFNTYISDATNAARMSANLFTNAFKNMEDALVNFVKTGKLDFKSLADSIITDLIRIQIQKSITAPLAASMNSGGLIAGIGKLFGFASGGNPPVGTPYVVGENGPEIRVDGAPGTILPNSVMAGLGGGGGVVVNVIESSEKAGTVSRSNTNGQDMINVFVERVKSAIAGDIARGSGAVPAAMSQTYGLNRVAGAY